MAESDTVVGSFSPVMAREARMLIERGEAVEALAEYLRWLPDRPPFVYNLQVRAAIAGDQDAMVLIKAVGEGGALIAFHSGRTMVDAITSLPSRARAGKLKWKEDEFPPSNYDQISRAVLDNVEHARDTWWGRSQGS